MTPRERVLVELSRITDESGLPATVRQLATACGYRAHQGVVRHLRTLQVDGLLDRQPGVSRSIQLTTTGKKKARELRRQHDHPGHPGN